LPPCDWSHAPVGPSLHAGLQVIKCRWVPLWSNQILPGGMNCLARDRKILPRSVVASLRRQDILPTVRALSRTLTQSSFHPAHAAAAPAPARCMPSIPVALRRPPPLAFLPRRVVPRHPPPPQPLPLPRCAAPSTAAACHAERTPGTMDLVG
jgi:hypothetical protein